MTRRLTSRSLAGTSRNDVAVGTSRLASMLATIRAPTPRIASPGSSAASAAASDVAAVPLAVVTGAVDGAGPAGAAGVGGRGRCRGWGRSGGGTGAAGRAVVREELLPGLADRCRVVLVLLVRLFDQPGVRTVVLGIDRSGGGRGVRHGAMLPTPDRCLQAVVRRLTVTRGHLDSTPC